MLTQHDCPILEFDDAPTAKLEPSDFCPKAEQHFSTDKLVITFFPEVVKTLAAEGKIVPERTIPGENPVEIWRFCDADILLTLGQVGCPACGGNLDLFCAMGITKVLFCGGGGVLDKNIAVGQLLLVDGAIRDEGFSYHYLPPARVVRADPAVTQTIAQYLTQQGVPFLRGLVWTTDAIFRETADRIARRRAEGAKIVEMEQAACLAVAQVRGIRYGALIYGGDDVSQDSWQSRDWQSRKGIRYDLVTLCRQLTALL